MLEAPCLRTCDVVESMTKDSGKRVEVMNVDGGMTINSFMMQTQADLMNAKIVRKTESEITGIGAAIAAGIQVGYWKNLEEVENMIKVERVFTPNITEEARKKKLSRWSQAVERSIGFGW
jgi:glycerol kinase